MATEHDFSGKKIWVVEDNIGALKARVQLYQTLGAVVEGYDNPLAAAAKLEGLSRNASETPPDLIVADYNFSSASHASREMEDAGYNLSHGGDMIVDAIKSHEKLCKIPVILLTGGEEASAKYRSYNGANVTIFSKGQAVKMLDLVGSKLGTSADGKAVS